VSLKLPGEKAKLQIADEEKFLEFVKLCFAQKRKTLVNNLRAASEPEVTRGALASLDLAAGARAEELSVGLLAQLFQKLHK
jgi:16S rRNA (adenine1518-N6/adenine1519-N6)-dimethyltransferase